jgi:hypothetical protein
MVRFLEAPPLGVLTIAGFASWARVASSSQVSVPSALQVSAEGLREDVARKAAQVFFGMLISISCVGILEFQADFL